MYQAFDTRGDFQERTVISHGDDPALNNGTGFQANGRCLPRMRSQLLHAQANTLALIVKVDDHDLDFVVQFNQLGGVANAAPAHIGNVQ